MHTLIVVRHAKASPADLHRSDFDRPLAAQGVEDAGLLAADLHRWHPRITAIVASPALRTAMTAEIIARSYGWRPEQIEMDERIYEASADALHDIVRELDGLGGTVILVGHNPGVLELCYDLTGGSVVKMPPGAVVVIPRGSDPK